MKNVLLLILLAMSNPSLCQTPDWEGTYEYTTNYGRNVPGTAMIVDEALQVEEDPKQQGRFLFEYEVSGYQTHYKLTGYALAKGSQLEFYFIKREEGVYYPEADIKTARPFFVMQYQKNVLLTKWLQPAAQKAFHPYFKQKN